MIQDLLTTVEAHLPEKERASLALEGTAFHYHHRSSSLTVSEATITGSDDPLEAYLVVLYKHLLQRSSSEVDQLIVDVRDRCCGG